jgi:hypothetical protein
LFFALGLVLGLSMADEGFVDDFESAVLDGWDRVSTDAHPPYNRVDPVPDPTAKSGKQVLRMTTQGGSTAIQRRPWPVDSKRPYRLGVFSRLTGTRRNSAAATLVWLNGDGDRVAESRSARLSKPGSWTELSIEVACVPASAVSAVVRLDFEGDDVRGDCDFDLLVFGPIELLEVRPSRDIWTPEEAPSFEVSLAGASAQQITCVLDGVRRSVALSENAARVDFPALKPGAYELEASVDGRGTRRTRTVLVRTPATHERLPELPAALVQAVVRGELTDADGPTRWWLAQQAMFDAVDGAVPMADPGIFPPGVREAAFRQTGSVVLALWSDRQMELPLSLNAGATLSPLLGARRPLKPGEVVRIGALPVFVLGIDPLLLELKLSLAGGDLPLQLHPSTRTLRLRNPYRTQTLRDVRVRLEELPAGWRVSPQSMNAATLAPDAELADDLQIALPTTEVERDQELRFEVAFLRNGQEQMLHLSRVVRLGSAIRIDAAVTDGPQAQSKRVSVKVTNASDRAMPLVLRARLPFLPEQVELLRSLGPGATSAPFEYVVKDVHLVDPARLHAELDVQESVGARATARRVLSLR